MEACIEYLNPNSSCYDDTAFARAVIDYVSENYCVDAASIHLQVTRVV